MISVQSLLPKSGERFYNPPNAVFLCRIGLRPVQFGDSVRDPFSTKLDAPKAQSPRPPVKHWSHWVVHTVPDQDRPEAYPTGTGALETG
jgi:hypothetical protein